MQMCWMQPIDFLISLNLLNNQATANALVISIQFSTQLCLHTCQGHSPLSHCAPQMCVKVAQKNGGKASILLVIWNEYSGDFSFTCARMVRMLWHSLFSLRAAVATLYKATSWMLKIYDLNILWRLLSLSLWSFNRLRSLQRGWTSMVVWIF